MTRKEVGTILAALAITVLVLWLSSCAPTITRESAARQWTKKPGPHHTFSATPTLRPTNTPPPTATLIPTQTPARTGTPLATFTRTTAPMPTATPPPTILRTPTPTETTAPRMMCTPVP